MKKIIDFGQFLNKINESLDSDLVSKIDYTLLAPSATEDDIVELCEKAKVLGVKSVCVLPKMVRVAAEVLEDSDVLVCTVVSFPHGTDTTEQKLEETKFCIASGADEIDMVLNYQLLKELTSYKLEDDDFDEEKTDDMLTEIEEDVKKLADECHKKGKILKVIVESGELDEEQTYLATDICLEMGADFIKTSTGFAPNGVGAELDKVKMMKDEIDNQSSVYNRNDVMKIKASGAIRTMADLQKFAPYVDRFGVGYAAVDTIFGGAKAGDNLY